MCIPESYLTAMGTGVVMGEKSSACVMSYNVITSNGCNSTGTSNG